MLMKAEQQEEIREGYRAAKEQAQQELGDTYKLIDIGEPATIEGFNEGAGN